jgi:NAD(P) transhydrogenase
MEKYDLIVIGSGPAGEKGAVKAAYFGKKVALVEKKSLLGGTLSSVYIQALLSSARMKKDTFSSFSKIVEEIHNDLDKNIRKNLKTHGVTLLEGEAQFINANTIELLGDEKTSFCSDHFLIATGSSFDKSFSVDYNQNMIVDDKGLDKVAVLGSSVAIYGSSPFCIELASAFMTLKREVFLITKNPLSFFDEELTSNLFSLLEKGVEIIHEEIVDIKANDKVEIYLENRTLQVEQFFDLHTKRANTSSLNLKALKIPLSRSGFIEINEDNSTSLSHVFAAGAVTSPLVQASYAMDQGRVAITRMFATQDLEKVSTFCPFSLSTSPEIAMVGYTEKELLNKKISFFKGEAHYSNIIKGKLYHLEQGFLKILFDPISLKVLGVHIIGEEASEVIHYGVALLEDEKTLHDVIGQVFSYPSYHELYKYAAYDGLGNLSGYKLKKDS